MRVMFYVQHLLGIGHLARASRIAAALAADGHQVTMVTGGLPVPGFPGPGVGQIALPPVAAANAGFTGLQDAAGNPVDDAFRARRTALLLQAFADLRPDVVMLEQFPFGRRQMRFELLPLLAAVAAGSPRPRVVVSLRDILQERPKPARDQETLDLVQAHVDHVLVHGDPSFVRLEDTFPLARQISGKVIYTGLVTPPPPVPVADAPDIVVSAGGGAVGAALVGVAVAAAALLPDSGRWCLITGPNLPQAAFDATVAAAPGHVEVVRFRQDFGGLLAGARLSVSQAGYNTVGDILRAGCAAIVVPFVAGGETEQVARAERLAAMGVVTMLTEAALTPQSLAAAIATALAAPPRPPHGLDIDGAAQTVRVLKDLLSA